MSTLESIRSEDARGFQEVFVENKDLIFCVQESPVRKKIGAVSPVTLELVSPQSCWIPLNAVLMEKTFQLPRL